MSNSCIYQFSKRGMSIEDFCNMKGFLVDPQNSNNEDKKKFMDIMKKLELFELDLSHLETEERDDITRFGYYAQPAIQAADLDELCEIGKLRDTLGNDMVFGVDIYDEVKYAIECLEMYGSGVLNAKKIMRRLILHSYDDIRFDFQGGYPDFSAFLVETQATKVLLAKVVRQALEDIAGDSEFSIRQSRVCEYLLDKDNQAELGLSEGIESRILDSLKRKLRLRYR